MPPVVLLFLAISLILAQLFHVLFAGRTTYLRRLIAAVAGVAIAEWAGSHVLPAGPRLGDLHLAWDVVFTTPLQLLANRFLAPSERRAQ